MVLSKLHGVVMFFFMGAAQACNCAAQHAIDAAVNYSIASVRGHTHAKMHANVQAQFSKRGMEGGAEGVLSLAEDSSMLRDDLQKDGCALLEKPVRTGICATWHVLALTRACGATSRFWQHAGSAIAVKWFGPRICDT